MSWGYFVELVVTLPTASLKTLKKKRASEVVLPTGWSGLRDAGLEAAFGRPPATRDTLGRALGWLGSTPALPAVQREETAGDRTSLRVLTTLEKSILDHAFPLVALFYAARDEGGEGVLRLVDDGTAPGEVGVELTLKLGAITARRLEDDGDLAGRLGSELFAPEIGTAIDHGKGATVKTAPRKTRAKPTTSANPTSALRTPAPVSVGGALFARFVERDALAWLSASRPLDDVTPLVDGEPRVSALGLLRYVHYRRSLAADVPATTTEAAVRLSLQARADRLTQVVLAVPADPSELARTSQAEVTRLGDAWLAGVTALAKHHGLARVPRPGAGQDKRAFRGSVDGALLEIEWARTKSAFAGTLCVGYVVLVQSVAPQASAERPER